ncbi:hypothetical protein [Burkholderia lata]|uniref:hypothetical protein n=1 Tax=Burkholderia lata (strain ATCC 17760 / DSM 23089 / LMG 22485 / NCIMB 9086 / R18194 / 383) TaxID=482957 RepID=UPI001581EE83|nr:hypothetical protein [Burkholderia lata]
MNVRKNARLAMGRRPELSRRVIERGPGGVSAAMRRVSPSGCGVLNMLAPSLIARIAEQLRDRRVSFRFVLQWCQ